MRHETLVPLFQGKKNKSVLCVTVHCHQQIEGQPRYYIPH